MRHSCHKRGSIQKGPLFVFGSVLNRFFKYFILLPKLQYFLLKLRKIHFRRYRLKHTGNCTVYEANLQSSDFSTVLLYTVHMAEETKVRDSLARDRTYLANERTLLAYFRTALALFLGGGLVLKFEASFYMISFAIFLFILGAVILSIGVYRFGKYHTHIKNSG